MPTLVFIHPDGSETVCQAKAGDSVMYAALSNRVKGILGECGGSLACATCHVEVEPEWLVRMTPKSDLEDEMLDATASQRQSNSRLSCQIEMSAELDGLRVRLPETQI